MRTYLALVGAALIGACNPFAEADTQQASVKKVEIQEPVVEKRLEPERGSVDWCPYNILSEPMYGVDMQPVGDGAFKLSTEPNTTLENLAVNIFAEYAAGHGFEGGYDDEGYLEGCRYATHCRPYGLGFARSGLNMVQGDDGKKAIFEYHCMNEINDYRFGQFFVRAEKNGDRWHLDEIFFQKWYHMGANTLNKLAKNRKEQLTEGKL